MDTHVYTPECPIEQCNCLREISEGYYTRQNRIHDVYVSAAVVRANNTLMIIVLILQLLFNIATVKSIGVGCAVLVYVRAEVTFVNLRPSASATKEEIHSSQTKARAFFLILRSFFCIVQLGECLVRRSTCTLFLSLFHILFMY